MSLQQQAQAKAGFVVSSANHVYRSKKASNLKSMTKNQLSTQGATKGLLNKMSKTKVSTGPSSKKPGFKQLVDDSAIPVQKTGIDLDVF